jgi:hypothetical protein
MALKERRIMRSPIPRIACTLTILLASGTASAEPLTGPLRRPPFEIGAGVSGIRVFDVDFLHPEPFGPSGDVRLTVPLTPRFSFEGTWMITRETNAFERRVRSLYALQIRQLLVRASGERTQVFLTYGGLGSYARVSSHRFPTYTEVEPPIYAIAGAAVQRAVARHLALRADAQVFAVLYVPLGVRVAVGASIPF